MERDMVHTELGTELGKVVDTELGMVTDTVYMVMVNMAMGTVANTVYKEVVVDKVLYKG
jgi:hypothetical protein